MFNVTTLNTIAIKGLQNFPEEMYQLNSDEGATDAIVLRSHNLLEENFDPSLKAVARAGAGVNNIPVDKLSKMGVPVFNTPGANANAVKELVLCGMLLAYRNICSAWLYTRALDGDDDFLKTEVEKGKKEYAGLELPGRTLGVIGLGAIGIRVANAALSLGMRVIGYDPWITVNRAWQLSSQVNQATHLEQLLEQCDFISVHVPLTDSTKHLINADKLELMKPGVVLLNFARAGIMDEAAVEAALEDKKVFSYVCDFPSNRLKNHAQVIALPHLGASTKEAEENCAIMAVNQLRDFLEHGSIRNSVNFPEAHLPRTAGHRLAIANENVPNMVGQITTVLADQHFNILNMLNRSAGEYAYNLLDIDKPANAEVIAKLKGINGVLSVRAIEH